MPSELNQLLLRVDGCLAATPPDVLGFAQAIAKAMALLDDKDYEVNRDLFDGVTNETRRCVVAGFSIFYAECLAAIAGMESPMQSGFAQAAKELLAKGKTSPVLLDLLLKSQKRGGN